MDVCFLTIGTFSQNAVMKRVAGLAPHVIEAGHHVTIVARDTVENREYFARITSAEQVYLRGTGLVQELRQKVRVIRHRNPDVVYACGWGLRNLPVLLGRTSIVEHAELLSANHETTFLQRQKNLVLEWLSVLAADGLVVASQYLQRTYEDRDLMNAIEQLYLPYGVDPTSGTPNSHNEPESTPTDASRVLYMGSLYASYGILDIVRSVRPVVDEQPSIEYIIVGDGPEREAAMELAQSLGVSDHINFKGYVDEDRLGDYLASADVFLAPLFETMKDRARCPSKIPMYMQYRAPVVTCRIGEAPAYLGDQGYYYAPGDPRSMAREIVRASRERSPVDYDLSSIRWEHLAGTFLTWLERDLSVSQQVEEV